MIERAPPFGTVPAKRPFANVAVQADWHDFLINERPEGRRVEPDFRFRLPRKVSKGVQYRAMTAGVTSGRPWFELIWGSAVGDETVDGSTTWVAEAIDANSLRGTILTESWLPAPAGLTLSGPSNFDLVYTIFAAGGSAGRDYELRHQITLVGAPAEAEEALIILPVRH